MNATEREKALTNRTEKQKTVLNEKLREYGLLNPSEREQRLQRVEFHWLTKNLMMLAPQDRTSSLSNAPALWRGLLANRLTQWDQLSVATQKEVLDSELMVTTFVQLSHAGLEAQKKWVLGFKTEDQPEIRGRFERWQKLSLAERQNASARFHHYFELPASEQRKSLGALTEIEREQMQTTLQAFSKLPTAQRRICVDSFGKFASMSETERHQFLKNVEVWQMMSPQDRLTWRSLVKNLPPIPTIEALPPLPTLIKPQPLPRRFTASNDLVTPF